jgi:hypothetical protein
MNSNYFMSKQFLIDANKSVNQAVTKAEKLGLPKAYVEMEKLPETPVVVVVSGAKKKTRRPSMG